MKVAERPSEKEMHRRMKVAEERVVELKKKEANNFNLLFLLAVNLYNQAPEHEIFNNNTFTDQFIEMIKKSAKAQIKARKENTEPASEEKK